MELPPLPPLTDQALTRQNVAPPVRLAIRLIVACLDEACRTVAEDCDTERHDDATSEGQLRWRRCRNLVKKLLDAQAIPGLEAAIADVTDNALRVRVDGTAVSFYSARDGIERPDLTGGQRTKKAVVNEMQQQIQGLESPAAPRQLVILYEAGEDGLAAAGVGMLEDPKTWAWRYSVYEPSGLGIVDFQAPNLPDGPTYETEPEPDLGTFDVIDEDEQEHEPDTGDE